MNQQLRSRRVSRLASAGSRCALAIVAASARRRRSYVPMGRSSVRFTSAVAARHSVPLPASRGAAPIARAGCATLSSAAACTSPCISAPNQHIPPYIALPGCPVPSPASPLVFLPHGPSRPYCTCSGTPVTALFCSL